MKKRFVIIHYNTPLLTERLVRSINLFVDDAIIYIFDNSDKEPFTTFYDNVLVLDNTKGDIINFDKWLTKYPNRNKSNGMVNAWGSAKHCYSVEKCMEILNENFILLDSDVLLKRDVSELFDENVIYSGEIITQPNSTIKRILPFICYINVKMCKKNKVHYFDDNYMHGLCNFVKNKSSDKYDTGAGFYINTSKFKHKDINYSDYVIHYGSGSWKSMKKKTKIEPNEWLNRYKKYWTNEKNKKVVYTCITGGYDTLVEPYYVSEGFDYICFTDNKDLKSDIWDIKPLPKETVSLTQIKKQRYVKINAHKCLSEYDISIWVDGNVELKGDLNELLKNTLKDDCSIYVPQHPSRKCIYDEASAVIAMKKDTKENINPQIERYKEEGFPNGYGLLQSNIMIRRHNDKECIRLMECWFNELKNGSHRDQLSFNYASWKNNDINVIYLDKTIYRSKWFNWKAGHNKKAQTVNKKRITQNKPKEKIESVKKKTKITTASVLIY